MLILDFVLTIYTSEEMLVPAPETVPVFLLMIDIWPAIFIIQL